MTNPVRVLLADVEGSARRALAALLRDLSGVALVGEVGDHDDIADALRATRADVLVLDDRLLRAEGHVLAGLGPLPLPVRVIVVGMHDDAAFADRAHRLGAEAWIPKDRADDHLPALLARP